MTVTRVEGRILQRKKRKGGVVMVVAHWLNHPGPLSARPSNDDDESIGRYLLDPNEERLHPILCFVGAVVAFQAVAQGTSADGLLLATEMTLVRCAPTPKAVRYALQELSVPRGRSNFPDDRDDQRISPRVSATSLGLDGEKLNELLRLFNDESRAPKWKRQEIAKVVRCLQGIRPEKRRKQKEPFISRNEWKVLGEWENKLDFLLRHRTDSEPTLTSSSTGSNSSLSEMDEFVSFLDESNRGNDSTTESNLSDAGLQGKQTLSRTLDIPHEASTNGEHLSAVQIINHPDPSDLTMMDKDGRLSRFDYLRYKKHPQVDWMVERVVRMQMERHGGNFRHVVDVGGGRGDLAVRLLQRLLLDGEEVTMTIVDSNQSSLDAGRAFAEQVLGLRVVKNNMKFVCSDFGDFYSSSVAVLVGEEGAASAEASFDLVVGLHACGNLSDAALAFAEAHHASCLICPCCYNKKILDLSQSSVQSSFAELGRCGLCTGGSPSPDPDSDGFSTVQRLAESPLRSVSERSMRVVNSARLFQMKSWCATASLEEYDMAFSLRNQVLVGNQA